VTGPRHFGTASLEVAGPVAVLRLTDSDGRNALRPRLRVGLELALAAAVDDPAVRVIVATGLDEVFCSGAPRETLLGTDGDLALDDYEPFARAFARCPLPVVAAMGGHAIGGGLVFGLYADVPVLSERSVYAANFLQYAIAPYVGATHVLPLRLGSALAAEMLLTARAYRGAELRQRGAGVLVVHHPQVLPRALSIAQRIAQAPRVALELLKRQTSAQLLADTGLAMEREREPHLASRQQAEVRQRAADGYGPPSPSALHAPGRLAAPARGAGRR
jgi:polyketide biosynthesis enoyl-CoA hydratase PksI